MTKGQGIWAPSLVLGPSSFVSMVWFFRPLPRDILCSELSTTQSTLGGWDQLTIETIYVSWHYNSVEPFYTVLLQSTTERGTLAMLRSFFAKEEGQGLVEYALILVLIAIVVIGILTLLGGKVSQVFSTINSGLTP